MCCQIRVLIDWKKMWAWITKMCFNQEVKKQHFPHLSNYFWEVFYKSNRGLFLCLHSLIQTLGELGEVSTVYKPSTASRVCLTVSNSTNSPSCLDEAMWTQKKSSIAWILLFIIWGYYFILFGVQRWRSGESTRLPPMWPGFDSQTRRHMWVEFVGSLLCTERFSPGTPVSPLLKKPTFDLSCVNC